MKHKINSIRSHTPKHLLWLLIVSMLSSLCNLSSLYGQMQQEYLPQWQVGTAWLIQTQYYQYYLKVENGQDVATQMIQWQYHVVEEDTQQFMVQVQSPEIPDVWMELWVEKQTMSVQRTVLHYTAKDEQQVIQGEFPGQGMIPQFAQVGQVPCQVPIFPLGRQDSLSYQRDIIAGEEIFEVTMNQQVEQTEDPAIIEEFLMEKLPEPIPIPGAAQYFIVQTQQNTSQVEQVWAEELPWFLYSADAYSVSWLIEF